MTKIEVPFEFPHQDVLYAQEWWTNHEGLDEMEWCQVIESPIETRDGCTVEFDTGSCPHGCWNPLFVLEIN
jgi:hypothetical protein